MSALMIPPVNRPAIKSPRQPIILPAQAREGLIYALLPIRSGSSRIIDYSGRGRHGSPTDAAWITKGRRGPAVYFTSPTGRIDTGSEWAGTGALTLVFSHWADGWGGVGAGSFVYNGKLVIRYLSFSRELHFSSDGGATNAVIGQASEPDGSYSFLCLTRTAAGIANFYKGDENTPPRRRGTADQSTGTPAAGTNNVFFGNREAADLGFDGAMNQILVFDRVLPLATIREIWRQVIA